MKLSKRAKSAFAIAALGAAFTVSSTGLANAAVTHGTQARTVASPECAPCTPCTPCMPYKPPCPPKPCPPPPPRQHPCPCGDEWWTPWWSQYIPYVVHVTV
jgi:hypothetical protein